MLENTLNSLNQNQIDTFKSDFNTLFKEIKEVLKSSGLFEKSIRDEKEEWEDVEGEKYWSKSFNSDKYIDTDEGINIGIGISKGYSFHSFNIYGISVLNSYKESGFFKSRIVFHDDPDDETYCPLKSENHRLTHCLSYNELIALNQSAEHKIVNSEKELILISEINKTILNYVASIDARVIEIKNEKKEVKSKVKEIISNEFDKDSNGELDVIQGDNLLIELLEKNESIIVDFDHQIIQKIIRLNKFLGLKRKNLSDIFEIIKKIDNETELKNFLSILRQSIDNYQSILIHSLHMVVSIKKKELIVYYEIYESFDEMGVFNSNWENEVSGKLSSINFNIKELMYSIESMESTISSGLKNLTYVTKSSFKELQSSVGSELESIRSGIGLNNLLTGINTYQLYKINKQTKGLID